MICVLFSPQDHDFFQHVEMHLRSEHPPLCGRDHLSFRSYYFPVKVGLGVGPVLTFWGLLGDLVPADPGLSLLRGRFVNQSWCGGDQNLVFEELWDQGAPGTSPLPSFSPLRQGSVPLHPLASLPSLLPPQNVIDGDLCEQFNSMEPNKQKNVAEELDRTPPEVSKKLEDIRTRYAF